MLDMLTVNDLWAFIGGCVAGAMVYAAGVWLERYTRG
jgi:hypothetical protein